MYRFISTLSSILPDEDLLYQSMVQDFFYSGFDIVNSDALKEYFAGPVRQSRMIIDEERTRYEHAIGKPTYNRLRNKFESIPDTQKPFYSMQFAYYVARQEGEKRRIAEERAAKAEQLKALLEKERKDYERLKAKDAKKKKTGKKNKRRVQSQKNARSKAKKAKKK